MNTSPLYALLGSGRIARHLHFYLKSLNLPVVLWSRDGNPLFNSYSELDAHERCALAVAQTSHVLFAVKDDAVQSLSEPWLNSGKTLVHFSGALQLHKVAAAHPLMTFGAELEDLDWYRSIPFVTDEGSSLAELLPGLPNPSWQIPGGQKPLYHALCSLAGNASFLLWKNIGDEFEKTLGLPRHLLMPFLHQVVANSSQDSRGNFTGPVARGDWQTVRHHLDSLHSRPELLQAYRSYLELANSLGHPVPEAIL